MKLTDFLSDVGRPVAYYPSLRKITGSTNATILLCQFIYWRGKESDPNGWLYKESDEIEKETGLSYGEQKTARRNLIDAGLIEEHYARLDHQMKFRLLLEAINEKWGNEETHVPESGKPQLGNDAKPLSLNESEITTENTTSKPKDIPNNMPVEWYVMHDVAVPQDWKDPSGDTQRNEFEKVLGFASLPWGTGDFEKFGRWVVKTYDADPQAFQKYVDWRKTEGKYNGMNNKQIRMNPQMFIDTGWPTFLASMSMSENVEKTRLL